MPCVTAERRTLGKTDLRASALGLGCWQFSSGRGLAGSYWPAMSKDTMRAVVKTALDAGMDWFDTAEVYGGGASERNLADALMAAEVRPGAVVVATKWWPTLRASPSVQDTFGQREEALRPFTVDLHQVHHPWSLSPVEAVMSAMVRLIEKKRIRAIGVSNYDLSRLERAVEALGKRQRALATHQIKYSLLDRRIERDGRLEFCRQRGVTTLAYSPLEQGLLTGKYHDAPETVRTLNPIRRILPRYRSATLDRVRPVVEVVQQVAKAHGATPSQVALAWTVRSPDVCAIVGARNEAQAKDNAGALQLQLTELDLRRLDEVSAPFADAPIK